MCLEVLTELESCSAEAESKNNRSIVAPPNADQELTDDVLFKMLIMSIMCVQKLQAESECSWPAIFQHPFPSLNTHDHCDLPFGANSQLNNFFKIIEPGPIMNVDFTCIPDSPQLVTATAFNLSIISQLLQICNSRIEKAIPVRKMPASFQKFVLDPRRRRRRERGRISSDLSDGWYQFNLSDFLPICFFWQSITPNSCFRWQWFDLQLRFEQQRGRIDIWPICWFRRRPLRK